MNRLRIAIFFNLTLLISSNSFAEDDHHHSDMHDVMAHLLTPASEKIWNASGFIITKEGEFSLEWRALLF